MSLGSISFAGPKDGPGNLRLQLEFKNAKVAKSAVTKAFGKKATLVGNILTIRTDKAGTLIRKVRSLGGIKSATPIAPPPPIHAHGINSVSRVLKAVHEYEGDYMAYFRASKGDDKAKFVGELPGCDYLEAYLHFLRERANPGSDSVDFAAYAAAERQRDGMPAGSITGGGIGTELTGNWAFVGPTNFNIPYRTYYGIAPLGGRINAVAFDPTNTSTYYIAGAQSGVWKTTDQGVNWTCLSDSWARLLTSCVVVDPVNTNVVYVGTGDYNGGLGSGFGIRKSTNGGNTWTTIGVAAFGSAIIKDIWIDPDDTDHLIAFTDRTQIKESIDGGASWTNATSSSYNISAYSAGVKDTSNVRALYATARSSANTVLRSLDNGDTWTAMTTFPANGTNRADIAASKIDPNTVYAMASSTQSIYKSTDRGATWVNTTNNFPMGLPPDNPTYNWSQSTYDMHMETSSNGTQDVIYVGLIAVNQSRDGGATWRSFGRSYYGDSTLHNDQHNMAVSPTNPEEILIANDGGLYRGNLSNQTTFNIQSLNAQLGGTTQFYHAAYHPTDNTRMIGGTQDNASPAALGNLSAWANPGAGDGSYHFVSQSNPAIQVTTWQYMGAERTSNSWSSSSGMTPSFPVGDSVAFIAPIEGDPTNGMRMYAGSEFLNRFNFSTNTWTYSLGATQLTTGTIRSIGVAASDGNRIYTGGSDGRVSMTTDGGATWTNITSGGLPTGNIKDIAVHPMNPDHVIVVQSSSSSTSRIWECKNPGAGAGRVWTSRSGAGATATPNIAHMSICLDPRAPSTDWYVATDVGVFMTINGGSSWSNITNTLGLPNLRVDDLTFVGGTSRLYAATHGRGIWQINAGGQVWMMSLLGSPSMYGANSQTMTVQLANVAPTGGAVVTLQSSNTSAVTVPASVTVPAGTNVATFVANAPWRANTATSTITATRNGDPRAVTITVTGLVADINRDGIVDIADYTILSGAFSTFTGGPGFNANADLNGDGIVDIADYIILANQFGLGG